MSNTDDLRETIRDAVGESLDWAMSDAVFEAADNIADAILVDEQTDASEIADGLVEFYTSDLLKQWQGLGAQGAADNEGLAEPSTDALYIIRQEAV